MKLKSHLCIANCVADSLEKNIGVKLNRKLFLFGSIKPDLSPIMRAKYHEYESVFEWTMSYFEKLCKKSGSNNYITAFASIKLGVLIHFLCDFFIHPHTRIFEGNLWDHRQYEIALSEYIIEHEDNIQFMIDQYIRVNIKNLSPESLYDYIARKYKEYLNNKKSIENDIFLVLETCMASSVLFIINYFNNTSLIIH